MHRRSNYSSVCVCICLSVCVSDATLDSTWYVYTCMLKVRYHWILHELIHGFALLRDVVLFVTMTTLNNFC